MNRLARRQWVWVVLALVVLFKTVGVAAQEVPVVRAVLFYSPTCPHCHKVINEDLPPLLESYGDSQEMYYIPPPKEEESLGPALVLIKSGPLEILYVNTLSQLGGKIFAAAEDMISTPPEERVVPMLMLGDRRLIGSVEIPETLPKLIDDGLNTQGVDWPNVPGLEGALLDLEPVPEDEKGAQEKEASAVDNQEPEESPSGRDEIIGKPPSGEASALSVMERIYLDPVGNSIAIVVLIGMVLSIIAVGVKFHLRPAEPSRASTNWLIPFLCVLGMGVAGYLTYIEATDTQAVCGPVGDCNTVQRSEYALLFGTIPVAGMGLLGYLSMLVAWFLSQSVGRAASDGAKIALFGIGLVGTLFSAYLTYLEPFVIGATCAWCLSSGVLVTALMWLASGPASEAWSRLGAQI